MKNIDVLSIFDFQTPIDGRFSLFFIENNIKVVSIFQDHLACKIPWGWHVSEYCVRLSGAVEYLVQTSLVRSSNLFLKENKL